MLSTKLNSFSLKQKDVLVFQSYIIQYTSFKVCVITITYFKGTWQNFSECLPSYSSKQPFKIQFNFHELATKDLVLLEEANFWREYISVCQWSEGTKSSPYKKSGDNMQV